ncbi:hypothetical protein J7F03_31255 [Streptomyces sp. ISL-43]|uniref:hypothetical protein n=1 Tax=Streptomyces sp. ISL-43 TaxID=2819183 RepID=UPI001BE7DABA|nr:hypothetical protein [Streptomyces sp. ISL-43]MBT2451463.1 hypothetical protein [Streptomyces sp. ISL-43]
MGRNTVRKCAKASAPEAMFHVQWQHRAGKLDPFKPYIHQRWNEGCTKASRLYREITDLGFRGGYSTLRDYIRPLREGRREPAARTPSPRIVARWITSHPDHLNEDSRQYLKRLAMVAGKPRRPRPVPRLRWNQ